MSTAAQTSANTPSWVAVCAEEDIPLLGSRRVAREKGLPVALFRVHRSADGHAVFALLDRCPHKAGPLSQGIVLHDAVACPLHGWAIGLADGRARAPDEGCTTAFSCKVQEGQVFLDADELATLALDLPAPATGPCRREQPLHFSYFKDAATAA